MDIKFQKLLNIQYQNEKLKKKNAISTTNSEAHYSTVECLKISLHVSIRHFLFDSKHLKKIINLLSNLYSDLKLKTEKIWLATFKMSLIL